ncbi:MAG: hypothetical protein LJE69_03355 [Thiohalocapsa sp.]|jgi:hypothetical protein|uniref:hypothetical protein n=1 Tax=Thiohalocapsa sp. TaxID=2497641 RepID=UPI0025F941BD|nr:hypothetical protein [Thiohalocapsa sp.]MCG6940271.1 hypothetical protein [Thiohalocapsa sp.]
MDYGNFQGLELMLFGGSAIALCLWQLRAMQRLRRQRVLATPRQRVMRRPPLGLRGRY